MLVSGSYDGTVRLWALDAVGARPLVTIATNEDGPQHEASLPAPSSPQAYGPHVFGLAVRSDLRRIAAGRHDNTICIFAETPTPTAPGREPSLRWQRVNLIRFHQHWVCALVWLPRPRAALLLSGGLDHRIALWDTRTRFPANGPLATPLYLFSNIFFGGVRGFSWLPGSSSVDVLPLLANSYDRRIQSLVLKPSQGTLTVAAETGASSLWSHGRECISAHATADGRIFASTGWDGRLRLWCLRTGRRLLDEPLVHGNGRVSNQSSITATQRALRKVEAKVI